MQIEGCSGEVGAKEEKRKQRALCTLSGDSAALHATTSVLAQSTRNLYLTLEPLLRSTPRLHPRPGESAAVSLASRDQRASLTREPTLVVAQLSSPGASECQRSPSDAKADAGSAYRPADGLCPGGSLGLARAVRGHAHLLLLVTPSFSSLYLSLRHRFDWAGSHFLARDRKSVV